MNAVNIYANFLLKTETQKKWGKIYSMSDIMRLNVSISDAFNCPRKLYIFMQKLQG